MVYERFSRRQARLFPRTAALLRRARAAGLAPEIRARYAAAQRPALFGCPWIGQNAHIAVLGAAAVGGWPALYLGCTAGLMTLIAAAIALAHERAVRRATA